MAVKISGMMGTGSLGHNNRKFHTENVDPTRSELNITLCRENLRQVYEDTFGEALAAYNAGKKKTRDKIPDYYRHIEKSKQEKLFHEVIFQIGNMENCHCGTPEGDRAAAALKQFAEEFQERNPHLRVFNSVIALRSFMGTAADRICPCRNTKRRRGNWRRQSRSFKQRGRRCPSCKRKRRVCGRRCRS